MLAQIVGDVKGISGAIISFSFELQGSEEEDERTWSCRPPLSIRFKGGPNDTGKKDPKECLLYFSTLHLERILRGTKIQLKIKKCDIFPILGSRYLWLF